MGARIPRRGGTLPASDGEPGISGRGGGGEGMHPHLHTYLGELEDVRSAPLLAMEDGNTYTMPMLPIQDMVLFPGQTLPLNSSMGPVLAEALRRALACKNLLAVVHLKVGRPVDGRPTLIIHPAGTIAEIKQAGGGEGGAGPRQGLARKYRRHPHPPPRSPPPALPSSWEGIAPVYLLHSILDCHAGGVYRVHVKSVDLDNLSVLCRICHKRPTSIPRAVQAGGHGGAHWAPWAYKAFDAAALALKAIK
mmetsp:Transcript_6197/g.21257  ORF Transcript_6197/g.21257 Transcript_6197/m.21257 type:complete len:249 (-) Transcript_6197:130-876(-)